MRILDLRKKSLEEIQKFSTQYPPRHYREIRAVAGENIKEFWQRAEREGAVAIFTFTDDQAAYIPIDSVPAVPQTTPLVDDLLQYYKVPRDAF